MGGFQPASETGSGFGRRKINRFGNLETIPPYKSKSGKPWLAGRIIMGKDFQRLPAAAMLDILNRQQAQNPLLLETCWLLIGHVDEFVQFLSFDNDLGFMIAIADTKSGWDLLKQLQASGSGCLQAISFHGTLEFEEPGLGETVDQILSNSTFLEANAYGQAHIDSNLRTLLEEIPIAAEDVIHVPYYFATGSNGRPQVKMVCHRM
jgi:protein-arginine deiminase